MGTFSIWHWLIVLAVVLILFGGGGKISKLMGDFGKGLKSFKKGLKEEDEAAAADAQKTITPPSTPPNMQATQSAQTMPPTAAPTGTSAAGSAPHGEPGKP